MASFLERLINNAANSVNEKIKEKVENGSFNRMAEGVGSGVSSLAAGMTRLIGMATKAFGEQRENTSKSSFYDEKDEYEKTPSQPRSYQKVPSQPRTFLADDDETGLVTESGLKVTDHFMAQLANRYEEFDDGDLSLLCMARLTVQTGLFFACCDNDYTARERERIEDYKEMVLDNIDGLTEDGWDALNHVFDDIEQPYTIDDIIRMTHRLVDNLDSKDYKRVVGCIDELIQAVLEADVRDDTIEKDYYDQWRREFMD